MNQRNDKGLKEGYWEHIYDNKLLSKGSYVDDLREGLWTKYWYNGGLCWTIHFKNDEPIGYVTDYNRLLINTIHQTSFII